MMMIASSAAVSVKRVVTCFILSTTTGHNSNKATTRENLRVAVFQRKSTMPTFASHWAGISGSMEEGEEPRVTARRELQEETNLQFSAAGKENEGPPCELDPVGGLYVDVPFQEHKIIRVYPFVVKLLQNNNNTNNNSQQQQQSLQLLGTEHDTFQFISISELEQLQPAVPGLARAFHHATFGKYLSGDVLPEEIQKWASDKINGASTLAQQAIPLAHRYPKSLAYMKMLRPTMVPIVNVLNAMEQVLDKKEESNPEKVVSNALKEQVEKSMELGAKSLQDRFQEFQTTCSSRSSESSNSQSNNSSPFTIATFSRSSTLLKILQRFLLDNKPTNVTVSDSQQSIRFEILCGKSTPGDEGVLMAKDLESIPGISDYIRVECMEDEALHQVIRQEEGRVQVVVVGADCIYGDGDQRTIINKVGTKALADTCQQSSTTSISCFTDRWKLWNDIFPPPLEDIFEGVPASLFDQVVIPAAADDDY